MVTYMSFLLILIILIPSSAYAYTDPGVGAMLTQIIFGGSAGVLVIIKLYWHKVMALFSKKHRISGQKDFQATQEVTPIDANKNE